MTNCGVALLRDEGVDANNARRINYVVRGHPLSLRLAVAALRNSPGLTLEEIAAGPLERNSPAAWTPKRAGR